MSQVQRNGMDVRAGAQTQCYMMWALRGFRLSLGQWKLWGAVSRPAGRTGTRAWSSSSGLPITSVHLALSQAPMLQLHFCISQMSLPYFCAWASKLQDELLPFEGQHCRLRQLCRPHFPWNRILEPH